MIPNVTAAGFPFEKMLSIREQGEHSDGVIAVLEKHGEPFNEFDFTVVSFALLAIRSKEIGLEQPMNRACCAYIVSHMSRLNSFSSGLLEAIKNAPSN